MNSRVLISVSEPWELGESTNWQVIPGKVLPSANDACGRVLVKLDYSINYHGSSWDYIVAEPRHEGIRIDALRSGERAVCGFTGITNEQAGSAASLDTQHWRGGLAFIGDFEATT
jgi:hypothetical protein